MTRSTQPLRMVIVALVVLVGFEALARGIEPHLPEPTRWGNPFTDAKAGQIEELVESGGQIDVVLAGSSIVNAGLDPTTFAHAEPRGRSAYNAGIPGVSIRYVDAWTREIVLPRLCPSLLVVGVTIRDYNDRGPSNHRVLQRYRTSVPRRLAVNEANWLHRLEDVAVERSAFVRLRSLIRQPANVVRWLRGERVAGWPPRRLTPLGRYVGFDDDEYETSERRREILEAAFDRLSIGGVEERSLQRLVETAQDLGIAVVLVAMPTLESRLAEYLPGGSADLARFRASIEDVAEHTGVRLLRFDRFVDREEYFADEYHLNAEGTRLVNEELVATLAPILSQLPQPTCQG